MRKPALLLITAALTALAPPARADYDRAERNFKARNYGEAYLLALPLAHAGDPRAQYLLALMSDNGLRPVVFDPAEAARWYLAACRKDHGLSCFALARATAAGRGVERDPRAALAWLQRAADCNNVEGLLSLAQLYDEGRGVEKDPEKATELIRRAAEQNDARAHFAYALRLALGESMGGRWEEAKAWFRKAADGGHPEALLRLAERAAAIENAAPEVNIEAYAWATLAEEQADGDLKKAAAKTKATLAKRMTPTDLAAAADRVQTWRDQHPGKP